MSKSIRIFLAALAGLASAAVFVPGVAQASFGPDISFGMQTSVTVGDTGVPVTITLSNGSDGFEDGFGAVICNDGDNPPCANPTPVDTFVPGDDIGINLVLTCGEFGALNTCAVADPGVFDPSATGVGAAGTECEGTVFDIVDYSQTYGALRFTPQAGGAGVNALGNLVVSDEEECVIEFTVDVVGVPTIDRQPGTLGIQTAQVGDVNAYSDNQQRLLGGAVDTSQITVFRAQPTITTEASAGIALGSTLTDTATVSGRAFPDATVDVLFELYGPDDADCSSEPVFTSSVPISATGDEVTSGAFTPDEPGTYRWIASYPGDTNNLPVAGVCGDPAETVDVTPAEPTITTDASAGAVVGSAVLTDTATVSGRVNAQPGATVTFELYGPDDATCATQIFESVVPIPAGTDVVTSDAFTPPTAGTYRWIASYGGDANNLGATGACNDANESATVTRAQPSITTDAGDDIVIGGELADTATVSGLVAPVGSTVDFALFGPDDDACAGDPVFTSSVVLAAGSTEVTSEGFVPTTVGTYRWVASYAGDVNNAPVAGVCGDPDETIEVTQAQPAITTDAGDDVVIGGELTDTATVTGLVSPVGSTVVFTLFGPDDADCSGDPVFTSTVDIPAGTTVVTSEGFTPTELGTYRWVASYVGDVNNAAVAGVCGDPDETVDVIEEQVVLGQPAITTDAGDDVVIGGELTDTATVTGLVSPVGSTVVFTLFGPDDAECSGDPVFTSTVDIPAGTTVVTSESFTPALAGTYRWIASYAGDDTNAAVAGVCGDPDETVDVLLATPTIDTQTSSGVVAGQGQVFDTATVSGRVNPQEGATIDFRLYGPGDTECEGTPVFVSLGVPYPVTGGPIQSASFTPVEIGTHRWVATYSGDANNESVAGECGDPDETFEVALDPETALPATGGGIGKLVGIGLNLSLAGVALLAGVRLLSGRRRRFSPAS